MLEQRVREHATLCLEHYRAHWGREFASKAVGNDVRELSVIGCYSKATGVLRCATVGLSMPAFMNDWVGYELFFACRTGHPNSSYESNSEGLLSLAIHIEKHGGIRRNATLKLVHGIWPELEIDSMIITEPVGEVEQACSFRNSLLSFELCWCLPLFESEVDYIGGHGISCFFAEMEKNGICELDLGRKRMLDSGGRGVMLDSQNERG